MDREREIAQKEDINTQTLYLTSYRTVGSVGFRERYVRLDERGRERERKRDRERLNVIFIF